MASTVRRGSEEMKVEAGETESIACNLCGAKDAAVLPAATARLVLPEPLRVVRCRQCGFMYVNPRLTRAAYTRLSLNEAYFQAYQRGTHTREGRTSTSRAQLARVERGHPRRGRLLEIGCATGEFLMEAREAGWQVFGVEPSAYMAGEARQHGLEVAAEFAPETYAEGAFDVVHMNHVLEHVPDPSKMLRGIRRVLSPSGLLVIEVPYEFGGWFQELYSRVHRAKLRTTIDHVSFFTPRTLTDMLSRAGFTAQVRTTSPRVRRGVAGWRRWAMPVLAYASEAFNRGDNIEALAAPAASL